MPSPQAFLAARQRHARAVQSSHPDTIILGGTSYDVAAVTAPSEVENGEGGLRPVEKLTARLLKTLRPTAPLLQAVIKYNGKDYTVSTLQGEEAWAAEWIIEAIR